MPFREGDEFSLETGIEKLERTQEALKQVTGHPPTDISPTCCDNHNNWIIYIGLSGKPMRYNPQPKGTARLPENIVNLYERFMRALMEAVQQGAAAEDRSQGYALSAYPPLRATQLEMRAYAVDHEALLCTVLATSSDAQQRIVAAEVLGFTKQSKSQLAALRQASRDGNSTVRNNATRALLVLVESNPKLAMDIPVEGFIEQLLSGTWTDLNKASSLLSSVTNNRNPAMLAQLSKSEVKARLIERARWRTGHAEAAGYILGRIAGIAEERIQQLVTTGQMETIINELRSK